MCPKRLEYWKDRVEVQKEVQEEAGKLGSVGTAGKLRPRLKDFNVR